LRAASCDVGTILLGSDEGFFVRQLLRVDELPHRAVINLEALLGQFHDQPTQHDVLRLASLDQAGLIRSAERLRFVVAHVARGVATSRRNGCSHLIAVLAATPKCAAA
jgi:hypothetical protein